MVYSRPELNVASRTLLAKTCVMCGLLLSGSRFPRYKQGLYKARCRDCLSRLKREIIADVNRETNRSAINSFSRWAPEEVEWLRELTRSGLTVQETAFKMGRSYRSIERARIRFLKEG